MLNLQASPVGGFGDPPGVVSILVGGHGVTLCLGPVTSPIAPNLDAVVPGTTG